MPSRKGRTPEDVCGCNMPDQYEQHLTDGKAALGSADWVAAREAFENALDAGAGVSARFGLADALWWLGKGEALVEQLESAYSDARAAGLTEERAWAALYLAFCQDTIFGNQPAAAGWCARGKRLIEERSLDKLRRYAALFESMILENIDEAERQAQTALDLARAAGDSTVELCAVAQLGEILIGQGRIRSGIGLLDEAMAGTTGGESRQLFSLAFASCSMIRGCQSCAEFDRASQWLRASNRFCERYNCPFLLLGCRTTYGALLFYSGDWTTAEQELHTALAESEDAAPVYYGEALATLADLYLAQGRIQQAEQLLAGRENDPCSAVSRARLHLLRGEVDAAAHTARHWRGALTGAPLPSARLLEVQGEADLLRGDRASAAATGHALMEQGAADSNALAAYGHRLLGYAAQNPIACREYLESALTAFRQLGMPYEAARSSLGLARALRETEPRMALLEARAAESTFRALGAERDVDAATALRRELGDAGREPGPRVKDDLTKREQQIMSLIGEGLNNPAIADQLCISRRTVEHHVSHILDKRGFTNRAEIAADAVRSTMEAAAKNR